MNEQISALMDGELDDEDAALALADLRKGVQQRQHWSDYHLIRDALRNSPALQIDLTDRVLEALLEEPVVLAPRRAKPRPWMQGALAMAASVAGIAVVSTVALGVRAPVEAQIAKAKVPAGTAQLASNDMQQYLIAHQSHTPSSSVQGASRYIKTVSLEGGALAKAGAR